jgi:hypothetical protein
MKRRELDWTDFADVTADVSRLQRDGYTALGKWDLSQICEHLSDWMTYPLDGFPTQSGLAAWIIPVVRFGLGKRMLRGILNSGTMSAGGPTLPESIHARPPRSQPSVERLEHSIDRLVRSNRPYHPSPLFGDMTRDELLRLHMIHCRHHLSFLVPKV